MRPPAFPQPPFPSGQPAPAPMLARRGCVGCLVRVRGCLLLLAALAVLATGGLWALSLVLHAPMQVFVNPLPYLRQYTFVVHHGQTLVYALAWSPDGKRIASAGDEGTVQVWDVASGRERFTYQSQRDTPIQLAWSPDGTRLALADTAHPLVVLDAASGRTIFAVAGSAGQRGVAWSPDGRLIAAINEASDVRLWDAASGEVVATLPADAADEVAWSPTGKDLAAASQDGSVRVWEVASGRVLLSTSRQSLFDYASGLAWSPDGQRIAATISAMDQVREQVWDVATGRALFTHPVPKARSETLVAAWAPDSRRLAIGGEIDSTIGVWDVVAGKKLLTYGGHAITHAFTERGVHTRAGVQALAWSPDGTRIVSLGIEETIQIWDAATANPRYVYDTTSGATLAPFNGSYATDGARAVAWSPDGQRVAIGGDRFAEVWKPA